MGSLSSRWMTLPILVAMLWICPVAGSARSWTQADLYRSSRDPAILEALTILASSPSRAAFDTIMARHVRIMFKDMAELGPAYQTHDALTIITDDDQQVIFVNARHANAPTPALTALISHEIMHDDRENSIDEEIAAWSQESSTWQAMLARFPELKKLPMRQVPLVDRENAILVLVQQRRLAQQIRTNIAYQGLPDHSPGY